MADVVDLGGRPSKRAATPSAPVIALLRHLLADAESGQLQQLAVVCVDANGVTTDAYSPGGHPLELYPVIGGLEVCKATLLAGMIGGADGG